MPESGKPSWEVGVASSVCANTVIMDPDKGTEKLQLLFNVDDVLRPVGGEKKVGEVGYDVAGGGNQVAENVVVSDTTYVTAIQSAAGSSTSDTPVGVEVPMEDISIGSDFLQRILLLHGASSSDPAKMVVNGTQSVKRVTIESKVSDCVVPTVNVVVFVSDGVMADGSCEDRERVLNEFRRQLKVNEFPQGHRDKFHIVLAGEVVLTKQGVQSVLPRMIDDRYVMGMGDHFTATFHPVAQQVKR